MAKDEVPISVNLLVVLGNGYLGPIKFTIWEHHKPNQMTTLFMDEPLQIPKDMRTVKKRYLYSLNNRSYLEDDKTYRDQRIFSDDTLFLTDIANEELFSAISQVIVNLKGVAASMPAKYEETRSQAVARGVLLDVPWVGPALDALIFGPKK